MYRIVNSPLPPAQRLVGMEPQKRSTIAQARELRRKAGRWRVLATQTANPAKRRGVTAMARGFDRQAAGLEAKGGERATAKK